VRMERRDEQNAVRFSRKTTRHRGGSGMNQRERQRQGHTEVLRVSSKSKPNTVAGAVAGVIREKGRVEIQTIGAGALNQAIKAIAIARGFLAPSGIDIVCTPSFCDVIIDGQERTAIRLVVEARDRG